MVPSEAGMNGDKAVDYDQDVLDDLGMKNIAGP